MISVVLSAVMAISVQEHLSGAEIGDAVEYVSFRSGGRYYAERVEGKKKSVARGTWKVDGSRLTVKVSSCKGPGCGRLGRPFTAEVRLPSRHAMVVRAEPQDAPLHSGAYYCLSQGCERRVGVEVVGAPDRLAVLQGVTDRFAEDQDFSEFAVAWVGPPQRTEAATRVEWCAADGARGKERAAEVARYVSSLPGAGRVSTGQSAGACQSEVRVVLGEGVRATR